MSDHPADRWLTRKEARELLKKSDFTFARLLKAGAVSPGQRMAPGGRKYYDREELLKVLAPANGGAK